MDAETLFALLFYSLIAIIAIGYGLILNNRRKGLEKTKKLFIDFVITEAECNKVPTWPRDHMRKFLHQNSARLTLLFREKTGRDLESLSRNTESLSLAETIERAVFSYK
jgi:hypothetical protein